MGAPYRAGSAQQLRDPFGLGAALARFSAEECQKKLYEWNDRSDIDLPQEELASVVRFAYQHRFRYRYGCHDAVLKTRLSLRQRRGFKRCSK